MLSTKSVYPIFMIKALMKVARLHISKGLFTDFTWMAFIPMAVVDFMVSRTGTKWSVSLKQSKARYPSINIKYLPMSVAYL